MRKTLIALIALAGAVSASAEREQIWTLAFGSKYGDALYKFTDYSGVGYNPKVWDLGRVTVGDDHITTTGSGKNVHTDWDWDDAPGSGLSWNSNFEFEIVFSVADGFANTSEWPAVAELKSSELDENNNPVNKALRFGPYTRSNNEFHLDGDYTHLDETFPVKVLTSGEKHTATLTVVNKAVTLKLDGVTVQKGALPEGMSSEIMDIALGGRAGDTALMAESIYTVSAYKLLPEPTTATLSLLALAGLAARRRRR